MSSFHPFSSILNERRNSHSQLKFSPALARKFSGLHFHENWAEESYRRFVSRGVLWTLGLEEPQGGLTLAYEKKDVEEPRPKPAKGEK